jgi:hypothetical protein
MSPRPDRTTARTFTVGGADDVDGDHCSVERDGIVRRDRERTGLMMDTLRLDHCVPVTLEDVLCIERSERLSG